MSEDMPNALMLDIKVSLARIEEKQKSTEKEITSLRESFNHQFATYKTEVDHKIRNLQTADQAFMPAREIEHKLDAVREHCDTNREGLAARISGIEESLRYYGRWVLGLIVLAGFGTFGSLWGIISKALKIG